MSDIQSYLKETGIHPDCVDMESTVEKMIAEMQSGLEEKQSSLEMIHTYISIPDSVPHGETVVVIDAGGTNFRVGTVTFDQSGHSRIENFQNHTMPGIDRKVTAQEFFEIIARRLQPVIDKSSRIGFCFSYPTEIQPDRDGQLIRWSKEVKAPEVVGMTIGRKLLETLGSAGEGKKIVLLNDTVATLLAGRAVSGSKQYRSYIGFILGTGTNSCYPEGGQIINTEMGNYNGIARGKADQRLIDATDNPEIYLFEKMISGAYLGPLFQQALLTAVSDGRLDPGLAETAAARGTISSKELCDLLDNPLNTRDRLSAALTPFGSDILTDCAAIGRAIVERAGKLAAAALSACALRSDRSGPAGSPVCITADGSTFYKMHGLKPAVEQYLHSYLQDTKNISFEIISVPDAPLLGTAIAGLVHNL